MALGRRIIRLSIILTLCACLVIPLAACNDSQPNEWDSLGGGGTGQTQESADTSGTDSIGDSGSGILDTIGDDQKNTDDSGAAQIEAALKIETQGSYKLTGAIVGQINVKAQNVTLFLDNCTITNAGKKVISSDYDLVIVLVDGTQNTISNTGDNADEANAISTSGKLTINGSGELTIFSTKSGIKSDAAFYGLGGDLSITAGSGHGISADSCILNGISLTINGAAKDGIHAETEDSVLEADPSFDSSRGYVYVGVGTRITIEGVYGDGIQADTYALIEGGEANISTLPTFVRATSSDSCYRLSGGIYSKVAAEDSKNYSSLYQLQQSCKGIKVGEIDYSVGDAEYQILTNAAYSLIVAGGQISIATTDDGLHCNSGNLAISGGTIVIATSDDGVAADKNLKISGGTISITQSYEAIEGETIDIMGGTIIASASDDGINASSDASTAIQKTTCYIKINGGVVYVSSGGDGIDSNGGVQISGGELYVSGPTSGADASLDSETGIIVTGGKIIALGSSGMVETPAANSTQYCVSINLTASSSGAVAVSAGGTTLLSFSPSEVFGASKNYQSIVISSPDFANGSSYSVVSGSVTTSATISGIITKVGNAACSGFGTGGKDRS